MDAQGASRGRQNGVSGDARRLDGVSTARRQKSLLTGVQTVSGAFWLDVLTGVFLTGSRHARSAWEWAGSRGMAVLRARRRAPVPRPSGRRTDARCRIQASHPVASARRTHAPQRKRPSRLDDQPHIGCRLPGDRLPDDAHETARDRITKTILRRGRACRVFACPPLAMGTTTLDRSN